jgi:hypothetical protein
MPNRLLLKEPVAMTLEPFGLCSLDTARAVTKLSLKYPGMNFSENSMRIIYLSSIKMKQSEELKAISIDLSKEANNLDSH